MDTRETRYRDDHVVYAGVEGENLVVPSANANAAIKALIAGSSCLPRHQFGW